MKSTLEKGDDLEISVFNLLEAEINADRFLAKKDWCRIYRKKGYYSRDRESNIIFDVSIEIFFPGADNYSILVLVECKNYSHKVPVDDVEEFFSKTQQVGAANTKAIMVASSAFQSGALNFSKSKKIGLARYFDPLVLKWDLYRSASAGYERSDIKESGEIINALTQEDYRSAIFDLFMQSPKRATNALWEFFEDLVVDENIDEHVFLEVKNLRGRQTCLVPFLQKSELEILADEALDSVGYEQGYFDLEHICARHPIAKGLCVERVSKLGVRSVNLPLGRIAFDPLKIELFIHSDTNVERDRFTFAHELAHLLLDHGKYMRREYCDESDYKKRVRKLDNESDILRMEYQANYFAACLLMPRDGFVSDFKWELNRLGLHDKGFGPLYVDFQECNVRSFLNITDRLAKFYRVSRSAVSIRLEGLGLLRDVRSAARKYAKQDDVEWWDRDTDDQY